MLKKCLLLFGLLPYLLAAQNPLFIPDTLSGTNINLTLQTGSVNFYPGIPTATMGANGNLLGPTLILNKHQYVTINVNNQLPENTTLHWHGLHVAPENDGGPHVVIPAGTTWSPSFPVMDWASTYWYHPHLHMKTNEHVLKGIAGLIIVRDEQEAALTLPRRYGIDDFPLVIQTKAFDANNQIVTTTSALDTALMVNGTPKPYLNAPGQIVRFRVLNGSSERTYNFGFSNNATFYQIGSDGGLLSDALPLTRLRLSPGERAEILADLSGNIGQIIFLMNYGAELPNAIYGAAQPGMGMGQTIPNYNLNPLNGANFNILQINVGNPTLNPVTTLPTSLVVHNPWLPIQANQTRNLVFMPQNMGPGAINGPFVINMMPFDMMMINYYVPYNNIEIWELRNQSPISHPFHIHNTSFYVLDINGAPPPANLAGRKDVILVPAGNTTVRFIAKFETFFNDTLPYMYHCHMLTHEDEGMMGQFVVTTPNLGHKVKARAILQGSYNAAAGLMQVSNGFKAIIPMQQPFNRQPWNYSGQESIPAVHPNMIDWILLQVYSPDGSTLIETKAALLLADGSIVDARYVTTPSINGVYFENIVPGASYRLAVRHRNHLALMSSGAIMLPNETLHDFNSPTNVLGGLTQLTPLSTTLYGLIAGDNNSDGVISVADFNDYITHLSAINQYIDSDLNFDRNVTIADFNLYFPNASRIGVPQIRY
ncbi:MAG TPA: multicopper oxidase domain-containing protein [Chitinophagales bacterium]|nr:multicopper oxidase domain-containing protein [Chitinophagales bacterium]